MKMKKTCIYIRDTGPGIPSEFQELVFEPFKRIDKLNQDVQGCGMGLWITKVLMEKMNGSVSIDSKFGKGTTIKVVFPIPAQ